MATSQIVSFATASGANVQDLASFLAAASTATGYTAGIASSAALNRTWRQSSFVAAAQARHLVNLGMDVLDDGDVPALAVKMRRAMGNCANVSTLNVNAAIPISSVGQTIIFSGASVQATLPSSQAVPVGSVLQFFAPNVANCRVLIAGADTFILGTGPSVSPLFLGAGDTAYFVAGPAGWYLVGGTISLRNSATFDVRLGLNGYITLPGGVIIQKGQVLCAAAATPYTFNFPISFPSSGVNTIICVTPLSGASLVAPANHDSPTNNSVAVLSGSANTYVDILAIGY